MRLTRCQEKAVAPHSSTLAWKVPWTEEPGGLQSMGSIGVRHDWAASLSLFTFHALEKEIATHSSVLAWRIPGTEEPGGLPSMGSHRVRHNWSDLAAAAAATRCQGYLMVSHDHCFFLLTGLEEAGRKCHRLVWRIKWNKMTWWGGCPNCLSLLNHPPEFIYKRLCVSVLICKKGLIVPTS